SVASLPGTGEPPDEFSKRTELLQRELQRVGCYEDAIDGVWGPASRKSMEDFNAHAKSALEVDHPTSAAIVAMKKVAARICPAATSASRVTPTAAPRSADRQCRLETMQECRRRAGSLGYTWGSGYCKGYSNRKRICR
ncbi:MAG: peptidoglycan-binding domain-containing protein, partial [Hyphomicrobiaceae bacterium]